MDELKTQENEKNDFKLESELKKLEDFKNEAALKKDMENLKITPDQPIKIESPKKEETEMERVRRLVEETTNRTNEVI